MSTSLTPLKLLKPLPLPSCLEFFSPSVLFLKSLVHNAHRVSNPVQRSSLEQSIKRSSCRFPSHYGTLYQPTLSSSMSSIPPPRCDVLWTPDVIVNVVYRGVMIAVIAALVWERYRRPGLIVDGGFPNACS
jgi:hypothetical protein